ncbi:SDR family oxidoreductase [Yeosuana marina]|uniref:SDR family oxidoreductase n=1 Tax=Yeosuana marina TaxID=1565536 RepID=UPI0014219894|nr:SDR family NAD(P)-dependent oxidoreductase [Yeosuana marina]
MRLNNNKILITGATTGIGKALAEKFLEYGNEIIVVGRNFTELEDLLDYDKRIIPFKCDISKQEELLKLKNFVEVNHTDLNILINNAGIQYNYNFAEEHQIIEKIDSEVDVNLLAPLKLTALLLPIIKLQDNAAIINVSSALAIVPKHQAPVYCSTKAAIHIFSKSLRDQLKNHVKIFEIIPPIVNTKMTEGRGSNKMSPEKLANQFIKAFKKDRFEINIGKVKLLRVINRICPKAADKIINRSTK